MSPDARRGQQWLSPRAASAQRSSRPTSLSCDIYRPSRAVSGTPLYESVDDLHGELNFLRVWPFALPNSTDGFWKHCISRPLASRDPAALDLLAVIMRTVMMRHSKSQTTLDGRPLLSLPPASAGLVPVANTNPDLYVARFLESIAREALEGGGRDDAPLALDGLARAMGVRVRRSGAEMADSLLHVLRMSASGAACVLQGSGMRKVHELVRAVVAGRAGEPEGGGEGQGIPKMAVKRALELLMRPELVQDRNKDMVRHQNNVRAQVRLPFGLPGRDWSVHASSRSSVTTPGRALCSTGRPGRMPRARFRSSWRRPGRGPGPSGPRLPGARSCRCSGGAGRQRRSLRGWDCPPSRAVASCRCSAPWRCCGARAKWRDWRRCAHPRGVCPETPACAFETGGS